MHCRGKSSACECPKDDLFALKEPNLKNNSLKVFERHRKVHGKAIISVWCTERMEFMPQLLMVLKVMRPKCAVTSFIAQAWHFWLKIFFFFCDWLMVIFHRLKMRSFAWKLISFNFDWLALMLLDIKSWKSWLISAIYN